MYVFGPFALDPARRVLTRQHDRVPISARAFDVLLALVERAGHTVDKDQLLRVVWPDTVVEEANLSQQIFTIRRLLAQTDAEPYITTVPRRGYRFVAPVENRARPAESAVPPVSSRAAPVRLELALPPDVVLALGVSPVIALAPDGSRVVYAGREAGTTRLYIRRLDQFEATPIECTERATNPFFSPDGQWLGFELDRRLQKIPIDGGPPLALCEVADLRGATWTSGGDIVYAPGATTGLFRVAATGGAVAALTTLDFEGGERTHRWPHALPDGSGVIFTIGTASAASFDEASLAIVRMTAGGHRLVLQHGTDGRCDGGGHLLWARGAAVFEAGFDVTAERVTGAPRVIQRGVWCSATGVAHFERAGNDTLVHLPGEAQTLRQVLVTVNRDGVEVGCHATGEALEEPRWSPDGVTAIVSLRHRKSDLWSHDFARATLSRLTFDGENFAGIFGPGPDTITFSTSHGGSSDLYLLRPDRSSPPELLVQSEFDKVAGAWSPDGALLVFAEYHPDTGADLWLLDRLAAHARPFVRTRFNEYAAVFSPDGRHVAYVSDESGRAEVIVVSCPEATGKRQLSTEGGSEPVWSRDGLELFYRSGNRLMRVDLNAGVAHAGIPTTLFEGDFVPGTVTLANYDVSADARTFLMVRAPAASPPSGLRVTLVRDGEAS